jgi:predicted lipoprotein
MKAKHSVRGARSRRRLHRGGAALLACLAIAGACKTATPDEVFSSGSGLPGFAGSLSPGSASASTGGRITVGGAGPNHAGQTFSAEGGAAGELSSTGGGAVVVPETSEDCGSAPSALPAFSRAALREAAADCAVWQYCHVENAVTALRDAVKTLRDDQSDAARAAAQEAWHHAMQRWSVAELFQYGPAGSKVESAGRDPIHGQGLRDFIYAWPVVGRCRVEEQVLGRGYEQSWAQVQISGRGLFGLEYLLFFQGADHGCSPNSTTGKGWETLDAAALTNAKLDYAAALSADVLGQVHGLREAWSPDGDNFRQTLIDAKGYESEQQALNVIAWSLLYIEKEVKDWKVGIPAGMTLTSPVSLAEGTYALSGISSIRENLRGFRALFQGCGEQGAGLGFDDWLNDVGQDQLARDMLAALDGAQVAADASPPLEQASKAELEVLYQALRSLTALLKADFFGSGSTLNLKLPAGVASDTD